MCFHTWWHTVMFSVNAAPPPSVGLTTLHMFFIISGVGWSFDHTDAALSCWCFITFLCCCVCFSCYQIKKEDIKNSVCLTPVAHTMMIWKNCLISLNFLVILWKRAKSMYDSVCWNQGVLIHFRVSEPIFNFNIFYSGNLYIDNLG